jgi:hypothetical protein
MQEAIIQQTIVTPQLTTAASMLISVSQPSNASLHRALVKAEQRLMTLPWRVDAGVLHIASHSQPNEVHLTDGEDCSCPTTRGICFHRAAWLILSTLAAGGCSPIANLPLPSILDDDEMPADAFLDGDFSAFADDSLTLDMQASNEMEEPFFEVDFMPVLVKRGRKVAA